MIAYLKGEVFRKYEGFLVVNINGVGYKVFCTNSVISDAKLNATIELEVYSHIKEDQFTLFGFVQNEEKNIFELLLTASGVGPKTALAILSSISAVNVVKAIQRAKVEELTKVPGVGKKLAQKIVVELQSKLGKLSEVDLTSEAEDELVQALQNLGFERTEAVKMAKDIDSELPLQQKIKLSLKKKSTND